MTTLAKDKVRSYELGDDSDVAVIASDIIYSGAAVGDSGAGTARPLVAGDRFLGIALGQADNTGGGRYVNLRRRGQIELPITGVAATDVGQPVYATDDDTFTMSPVGGSFIGFVKRYVSSGVGVVDFDPAYTDPYALWQVREAITDNKTLDIEDNGKLFWVSADAKVITLPAVATPVNCLIVNGGAAGAVAVNISPNASDRIQGPDIAGADNKDLINTKATARRGDYAQLITGDANGPIVSALRGIWATEAA